MMKAEKLVEIAKRIASEPTVYYSVAGGDWCKWNGSSWNMDCVCMIKGILWGFDFNKSASHGGAIYGSNNVADDTADGIINRCTNVSRDFSTIEVGELMHMDGHVGIYIGNGQVVESTAWYGKTIISNVDSNGRRFKDSNNGGYWKEHGKLQYVDYSTIKQQPQTTTAKYLNLKPTVSSWTVYKTNNYYMPAKTEDVRAKLNPMKFGGLTYKILEDMGNYHFKIKTDMFGIVYIAGNPNKYDCSITETPVYTCGNY